MLIRFLTLLILSALPLAASTEHNIIPIPQKITLSKGAVFELSTKTVIFFDSREAPREIEKSLQPVAEVLASELELITGIKPAVKKTTRGKLAKGHIHLRFKKPGNAFAENETEEDQSYTLHASPQGVVITSAYSKGISYGTASLIQGVKASPSLSGLPAMKIEDAPKYSYRSIMIDVARKPHSIAVIKDVIRMARMYKMRYVQLHLTDDQLFTFPFEPVTSKLTKNKVYTRDELLDLVRYADARGVTLIPELDLPGHTARLMQSGYLDPGKSHADVADPANFDKITAIIDDILSVFSSSPYFHIGGDESGAGQKLIPFLKHINKHVRSKKRRLLVWEGFHGSPTRDLPAKGDDRIIVMAWESSYNAPWDLLKSGYEIINASWKPTYVVGGGGLTHPGNTSGRRFLIEDIRRWDPTIFMHWEPGRPIYEDRGPKDKNKNDGEWDASVMNKNDQILGGQLLYWEQSESVVIEALHQRTAAICQRLWNPEAKENAPLSTHSENALTVIQPVQILPAEDLADGPITDFYTPYDGDSLEVRFKNRSMVKGDIRFVEGGFRDSFGFFGFPETPHPTKDSKAANGSLKKSGGFSICAKLFRKDGTAVDGTSWAFYNNWPMRVSVTEYEMGRRTLPKVADLASLPKERILRKHTLPMLRGPLRNVTIRAQLLEGTLIAPETGEYQIGAKTQNGHASLYLDLNQNRRWDPEEKLITDTPKSEKRILKKISLKKGQKYHLRVDHNTGIPRPVLIVTLEGPGIKGRSGITPFLEPITE